MDPAAGSAVILPAALDTAMLPSIVLTVSTHDRLALLISLLRGENGDVLTPEGACLIGLSEGQSMRYWRGAQPVCDVTLCAVSPDP